MVHKSPSHPSLCPERAISKSVSELRSPRAERSQASQKESDRSNLDQGFAAGRQALIIASQTPVPDQPAQSAFHFPSVPLDLEASREANQFAIDDGPWVRFGHNFGVPTQMHFDPGNERPSIAAVSEQMRKARETASQLLQEQGSTSTIDEPSRMNLDGEQQSEGINQNMPLATIDFFQERQTLLDPWGILVSKTSAGGTRWPERNIDPSPPANRRSLLNRSIVLHAEAVSGWPIGPVARSSP